MLLGFNMLLWASQLTDEHFPLLAKVKAAGYDGAELPLFGGTPEDYVRVGHELKNLGLRATAVCVMPDKEHIRKRGAATGRGGGLPHHKGGIDCREAGGGGVLWGRFNNPLGISPGNPPPAEERAGIVEFHKAAPRHAAKAGIALAVEPLNR